MATQSTLAATSSMSAAAATTSSADDEADQREFAAIAEQQARKTAKEAIANPLEVLRQSHTTKTAKEMSFHANQGRNSIGTFETLKHSRCDKDCAPGSCQQQHSHLLAHLRWATELRHIAEAAVSDGRFQGDGFSYAIELTPTKSNNIYHTLQPTIKDVAREEATYCLDAGVTDVDLNESEDLNQNYKLPLSEPAAIAAPADEPSATVTKAADLVTTPEPKKISPLLSIRMYGTVSKGSYSTVTKFVNPGADFPSLAESNEALKKKVEESVEESLREQKELSVRLNKHKLALEATRGRGNPNQSRGSSTSGSGLQSRNGSAQGGREGGGGPRNSGGKGVDVQKLQIFQQWEADHPDLLATPPQFQTLRKAPPQVAFSSTSADDPPLTTMSRSRKRSEGRRCDDSSHSGNSSRSNESQEAKNQ
jgi:hypothetical protein